MSATICWKPVTQKERHFEGGTSSSYEKLSKTFGSEISKYDIQKLRGMGIFDDFYNEVADTIEKVGNIQVWIVY